MDDLPLVAEVDQEREGLLLERLFEAFRERWPVELMAWRTSWPGSIQIDRYIESTHDLKSWSRKRGPPESTFVLWVRGTVLVCAWNVGGAVMDETK